MNRVNQFTTIGLMIGSNNRIDPIKNPLDADLDDARHSVTRSFNVTLFYNNSNLSSHCKSTERERALAFSASDTHGWVLQLRLRLRPCERAVLDRRQAKFPRSI